MRNESPQRGTVRQKDGEVIKSEQSTLRNAARRSMLSELDDLAVVVVRTKDNGLGCPVDYTEAENFFVVSKRTVEISYLKPHSSQSCRFRQPVIGRSYAAFLDSRRRHAVAVRFGQKVLIIAKMRSTTSTP